ncbi:MAG TPA: alpha/beta fold hydrolase [Spirochaetia bacterium]|nr:alpha/beta fold hydrolase [Spirochaetia bacterium]
MSEIPLLVDDPANPPAPLTVVLAHGAGAAMDSSFMNDMARGLAAASFRVARFEFPYMQAARQGGKRTRPDVPAVLEATWMQVIQQLGGPANLVIGGKSMGGRIASMVADRAGVRGLVCLGYPFHPTGAPGTLRVAHLAELRTPTLILQGERDTLGSRQEIAGYQLSAAIRVSYLPDGDHSFKPRKASGTTYARNMAEAISQAVEFCRSL